MIFRKIFKALFILLLITSFASLASCGFFKKIRKGDSAFESNIQSQDKNFLFLMADKEIEEENYDAAATYLTKAIELETDSGAKWFLKIKLAKLYFDMEHLDSAGEICAKLVAENPKDIEGHLLLGKILARMKELGM